MVSVSGTNQFFSLFLFVFGGILKYLLQFTNEYEELETLERGDHVEAFSRTAGEASGGGG